MLAIVQLVGGLYLSYLVRVVNDLPTALQIIPVHTVLAVVFLALLASLAVRASKLGHSKLLMIPLALLVLQSILGVVIALAIYQIIAVDLRLIGSIGLFVHNPLGIIVTATTVYGGIKVYKIT